MLKNNKPDLLNKLENRTKLKIIHKIVDIKEFIVCS